MINEAIISILNNNDSDYNMQECFDEMFSGLSAPILSGIFLSLLKLEEETSENILQGINSARNSIKKIKLDIDYDFLIENICINKMPDYIDLSFAMDIVCRACEIGVVKSLPSNYAYKNSSFDILKCFGGSFDNFKEENFEKVKFLYSYISSDNPYIKYTQELFKVLPYDTILNRINCFLNPYGIKNCTVALLDKTQVEKYAKLCLELGYTNSIIFSGDNFPYVSIEGETAISEAWKNKIFSYSVTPELLGIKPNSLDSIKVENIEHSAEILKAVFENKLKDSCYDAIIINSGLALYITKKAKSLMEGINLARKTIDEGKAQEILLSLQK